MFVGEREEFGSIESFIDTVSGDSAQPNEDGSASNYNILLQVAQSQVWGLVLLLFSKLIEETLSAGLFY